MEKEFSNTLLKIHSLWFCITVSKCFKSPPGFPAVHSKNSGSFKETFQRSQGFSKTWDIWENDLGWFVLQCHLNFIVTCSKLKILLYIILISIRYQVVDFFSEIKYGAPFLKTHNVNIRVSFVDCVFIPNYLLISLHVENCFCSCFYW